MEKNPLATQTTRLILTLPVLFSTPVVIIILIIIIITIIIIIIIMVTNHGEESTRDPDNKAHVDAAGALQHPRRRHKDPASNDAPNDHLGNHDDAGGGADDDDDCYSASIEEGHFCFESDSLPIP